MLVFSWPIVLVTVESFRWCGDVDLGTKLESMAFLVQGQALWGSKVEDMIYWCGRA